MNHPHRLGASSKPQRRVSERHLETTLMEFDQHLAASLADTVTGYHNDYVAPLYPAVKKLVSRLSKRFYRRQKRLERELVVLRVIASLSLALALALLFWAVLHGGR